MLMINLITSLRINMRPSSQSSDNTGRPTAPISTNTTHTNLLLIIIIRVGINSIFSHLTDDYEYDLRLTEILHKDDECAALFTRSSLID